ncbi:hypothetical protein [Marinomonas sp. IMCC 4694]|uniref:hypothetical protein n=1 Tax=Marinomonas sp. IMCC 4694 TaxID=2605432 RepID=UPI0011E626A5|nr:hypothetical protein [Marinomonas sp. IMCC 4694]
MLHATPRGWVSLPIIAVLLAVSTLSFRYQDSVMASYQWRGQLSDVNEAQQIWIDFQEQFVRAPRFMDSVSRGCQGFCRLTDSQFTEYEKIGSSKEGGSGLFYQWNRYEKADTTMVYRLCGSQNQRQYQCWWWQDHRLMSAGWVSASD